MKECFLCGRWCETERHHLIGGTANRRISDRYGLTVDLCRGCHRLNANAAHRNAETARKLHEYAERKWLAENGGTVDDFRRVFGRNYLDGGDDDDDHA